MVWKNKTKQNKQTAVAAAAAAAAAAVSIPQLATAFRLLPFACLGHLQLGPVPGSHGSKLCEQCAMSRFACAELAFPSGHRETERFNALKAVHTLMHDAGLTCYMFLCLPLFHSSSHPSKRLSQQDGQDSAKHAASPKKQKH